MKPWRAMQWAWWATEYANRLSERHFRGCAEFDAADASRQVADYVASGFAHKPPGRCVMGPNSG